MRVLYGSPFWQERSGPEESLLALLGSPTFAEVDPVVALPGRSPYVRRFADAGISTVPFDADLLRRSIRPGDVAAWARSLVRSRRSALELIRTIQPDVVHSNMESTFGLALAARASSTPHVHHVRSLSIGRPRFAGTLLLEAVSRLSVEQIAISQPVAALFPRRADPTVIENPVSEALFDLDPMAGDPPVVLVLGRINPRKGLEIALEVASRTAVPAAFHFVGPTDPDDAAYGLRLAQRARALQLDERVRFLGPRPAAEALAGATVLLNTGVEEGFGRVVAEAMAAGVAVVARRGGAIDGLVADGLTGLLFDDPGAGAAAIDRLIRSNDLRSNVVAAARAAARLRFTADGAARSVLTVYERAMRTANRSGPPCAA